MLALVVGRISNFVWWAKIRRILRKICLDEECTSERCQTVMIDPQYYDIFIKFPENTEEREWSVRKYIFFELAFRELVLVESFVLPPIC